jgi:hypothetical protein
MNLDKRRFIMLGFWKIQPVAGQPGIRYALVWRPAPVGVRQYRSERGARRFG